VLQLLYYIEKLAQLYMSHIVFLIHCVMIYYHTEELHIVCWADKFCQYRDIVAVRKSSTHRLTCPKDLLSIFDLSYHT
jgi:hypothetical protein